MTLQILTGCVLRVCPGSLNRLDVSLSEQQKLLAIELDLEGGLRQEQHPITGSCDSDVGADQ